MRQSALQRGQRHDFRSHTRMHSAWKTCWPSAVPQGSRMHFPLPVGNPVPCLTPPVVGDGGWAESFKSRRQIGHSPIPFSSSAGSSVGVVSCAHVKVQCAWTPRSCLAFKPPWMVRTALVACRGGNEDVCTTAGMPCSRRQALISAATLGLPRRWWYHAGGGSLSSHRCMGKSEGQQSSCLRGVIWRKGGVGPSKKQEVIVRVRAWVCVRAYGRPGIKWQGPSSSREKQARNLRRGGFVQGARGP